MLRESEGILKPYALSARYDRTPDLTHIGIVGTAIGYGTPNRTDLGNSVLAGGSLYSCCGAIIGG